MDYIVKTPCGPVLGAPGRVPGTVAYKGIRYATAGRWEYPQEVTSWEGIYDATRYGNCSYQPRAFYDEEKNEKKYFYYNVCDPTSINSEMVMDVAVYKLCQMLKHSFEKNWASLVAYMVKNPHPVQETWV